MAAKEGTLGLVHQMLALSMVDRLKAATEGMEFDDVDADGNAIKVHRVMPLSASEMQAMAKFLKDNEVTCAPGEDNAMGELQKRLQEREAAAGTPPSKDELQLALRESGFMGGVH